MGRQLRLHLPGAACRLSARCQGDQGLCSTPAPFTRLAALLAFVASHPDPALRAIARPVRTEKGPDPGLKQARRIAAYLRLSPTAVSSVLAAGRKRLLTS
ncbi:MAG TPA: hypothetical protein VIL13_05590 [Longimicrobiales bacterium]|jgi:hypothetical protein